MRIGIFDSGLGGKIILEAVRERLPHYDYVYYGDTAHVPYGDRSEETIYALTKQGIEYLVAQEWALIVLACNTASAETLRRLQDERESAGDTRCRILGVIIPTIETITTSACKRILLLATSRTVSSGKYHLELGKRHILTPKVDAVAIPSLVPAIEAGEPSQALDTIQRYLATQARKGIVYDGIILGCTHYSILVDELRAHVGTGVRIFAQTEIIPDKLAQYIDKHRELQAQLGTGGTCAEYVTGE